MVSSSFSNSTGVSLKPESVLGSGSCVTRFCSSAVSSKALAPAFGS